MSRPTACRRWSLLLLAVSVCSAPVGCTPRVIVHSNPDARDQGIRYYRPKPYLLVAPLAKDGAASPDHVSITLDYLPDFSEEYSINVRSGLGLADVSVQLEDGWNLVAINQKLDSQTDETIKATGELLKSVIGSPNSGSGAATARPVIQVPARNVPLGYYEAVIGKNRHGKKQLYGFRYVGFMPFQACPIETGGSGCVACSDELLYGLTFDSGIMTFKPLCEIAAVLPPSEQTTSTAKREVPVMRNFSRSWSNKGGKTEDTMTIQDSGSVPITVPLSDLNVQP